MKKYELTLEHREQLKPWHEKWVANAFSTKSMSAAEKKKIKKAIKGLYEAAGKKAPPDERIVFVQSPFVMRFAGGYAAAIWWLRKNQKRDARAATEAATEAATWDATRDATRDATWAATWAATRDATWDATRDATEAATWAATKNKKEKWFHFNVFAAIDVSVQFGLGKFGVDCAENATNMWDGGNQWSGWPALISFFRYVAKLNIDYSKWDHYEAAAAAGPRIMHEEFCIISERPEILLVDDQNRPHAENGPFCRWRDGSAMYAWHGTRIPGEWVEDKLFLTPDIALTWPNAEERRCAMEIIGFEKLLKKMNAKLIDKDPDDTVGQLYEVNHPAMGGKCKFLRMYCPTGRWFAEAVPPEMKTALQANAWGWDLPEEIYKPRIQA